MENGRFILYVIVLGAVFLLLTAVKMILPHDEPKEPVDIIGMRLYRPIFFGEPSEKTEEQTQTDFQDSAVANIPEDKPESEKPLKIETEKTVTKKSNSTSSSLKGDAFFEKMIADYRKTTLKERKYRNDVVVRYYRHEPDGDKAQVLVDYGFYLHERPVSDKDEFKNVMSNVIYYGQDFPESDLKLITYLLIKNGIEIKEVRRFKDFDGWKHEAIEIGASKYLVDDPVLTSEQIRAISVPN